MLFNEEEYRNGVADFFGALNAFGAALGEALDNYLKEEYEKVNTPDEQIQPEESAPCDCEDCKCTDECCEVEPEKHNEEPVGCKFCKDCDWDGDPDECPAKQPSEDVEEVNEAGPAGPREEYDSYKITISDYNVKGYEEALEIMKPKLNDLTFAMRTFTFGEASLEFRFPNVTYRFFWDKDSDMFIGLEDSSVITKEVFWDEIDGQIKDITDENLNTHNKNVKGPDVESTGTQVPGNECIYKNNSFYPYGKKCENCPEKDKCYAPETEVVDSSESHSATYDADGNAIAEEEIPTLDDYVDNNRKTVEEEPGFDSGYGDLVPEKEVYDVPVMKEISKSTYEGMLAGAKHITAKEIYKNVNSRYVSLETCMIESMLVGVERLLKSELYGIVRDKNSNEIKTIKFTIPQIYKNMQAVYLEKLEDVIHLHNLSTAIKERFGFTHVEIHNNNTIYCDLV